MTEESKVVRKKKAEPQKRNRKSGAAAEIDKRLAEAIRERTQALKEISLYAYAQDKYMRLTQEINELIGMGSRMNGSPESVVTHSASPTFSVGGQVPAGVSSIPARQPGPVTDNIADKVSKEGGFS